MSRLINKL